MEQDKDLLRRATRHLAFSEQPLAVGVDPLGGDLAQGRALAELGD
jgi:hypothetical protein